MRPIPFPAPRTAALLALLASAAPLSAQTPLPPAPLATTPAPGALVYPGPRPVDPNDPVEILSRNIRVLAANPRDLAALMGAGHAAMDVGDPPAALGFYARADEIAPRDGRIKAGLAAALTQMEQTRDALRLFDQAVALGVPEADIAGDRGLAHDLRGDSRRAQADYAMSLRAHDDPEIVRRLALSMAISGDRAGALAMIGGQLRARDRGALRTRAFILALTGDMPGATNAVQAALPGPQAAAMLPFFGRLEGLRDGQKAAAVNLGHFPATGREYSEGELFADATGPTITPPPAAGAAPALRPPGPPVPQPRADAPLIPSGAPLGTVTRTADATPRPAPTPAPVSTAPRRRPGAVDESPARGPAPGFTFAAPTPAPAPAPTVQRPPVRISTATPPPAPRPAPTTPAPATTQAPVPVAERPPVRMALTTPAPAPAPPSANPVARTQPTPEPASGLPPRRQRRRRSVPRTRRPRKASQRRHPQSSARRRAWR